MRIEKCANVIAEKAVPLGANVVVNTFTGNVLVLLDGKGFAVASATFKNWDLKRILNHIELTIFDIRSGRTKSQYATIQSEDELFGHRNLTTVSNIN